MTEAELMGKRIADLEAHVDTLTETVLRLFQVHTGQRVDEIRLRGLIEKLGARTRTKVPEGVKL